jgi:hypothetical protein
MVENSPSLLFSQPTSHSLNPRPILPLFMCMYT